MYTAQRGPRTRPTDRIAFLWSRARERECAGELGRESIKKGDGYSRGGRFLARRRPLRAREPGVLLRNFGF